MTRSAHLRPADDRRALLLVAGVVLVIIVAAVTVGACQPTDPRLRNATAEQQATSTSFPSTTAAVTTSTTAGGSTTAALTNPGPTPAVPDGPTTVAMTRPERKQVQVYAAPDAATPTSSIANPGEYGNQQVFVVVEQRPGGWLHVLLPIRPNGSHGWIRADDVTLVQHDYRIDVSLSRFTLRVRKGSQTVLEAPIGVGTSDTPTPAATYYTWVLLAPTNSGYGQYAYGLSGFSDVLQTFAGGDARLGIHGTSDASSIGHNVSKGCIRVSDATVKKMVETLGLPLGIPVTVTA